MLKKKPFFSIIIPTLNEEYFIPELLLCLERQTFKNFEVIVCDSLSTDKTIEEVRKFRGKIINLNIINSKKRLVAYQRNLGAKKAKGEYLIFLDADVRIPPDYLEKIYQAIKKTKSCVLITRLKGDINTFPYPLLITLVNLIVEFFKFINKPFFCGAAVVINKKAFYKVKGFREDLTMSEDHELSLRLSKKGYQLTILKYPYFTFSLRRIKSEGLFNIFWKYTLATLYFILKGPITRKLYSYEMGGHIHRAVKL